MSCAKNSQIGLVEIWEAVLRTGDRPTTSLVQNTHKELVHPPGTTSAPLLDFSVPTPVLDFNAPANLVHVCF
jgi:hypothetical protein